MTFNFFPPNCRRNPPHWFWLWQYLSHTTSSLEERSLLNSGDILHFVSSLFWHFSGLLSIEKYSPLPSSSRRHKPYQLLLVFFRFVIARILLGSNSLVTHHYHPHLSPSYIDPLHTAMDRPIGRRLVSRFVIAGRQSCGHSQHGHSRKLLYGKGCHWWWWKQKYKITEMHKYMDTVVQRYRFIYLGKGSTHGDEDWGKTIRNICRQQEDDVGENSGQLFIYSFVF